MTHFPYIGDPYDAWTPEIARLNGVSDAMIGRELKRHATRQAETQADRYRQQLASASAGKLQSYAIKAHIAAAPNDADPAELALLDREATARGLDRAGLLEIINTKHAAYRQLALLVEVFEAEAKQAIAAIPDDDPDIETTIRTVMADTKAQAEAAFAQAQSQT